MSYLIPRRKIDFILREWLKLEDMLAGGTSGDELAASAAAEFFG